MKQRVITILTGLVIKNGKTMFAFSTVTSFNRIRRYFVLYCLFISFIFIFLLIFIHRASFDNRFYTVNTE